MAAPLDFASLVYSTPGQLDQGQTDEQPQNGNSSQAAAGSTSLPSTTRASAAYDGLDDLPVFDFPQESALNPSSSFSARGFGDYSFPSGGVATSAFEPFPSLDAFSGPALLVSPSAHNSSSSSGTSLVPRSGSSTSASRITSGGAPSSASPNQPSPSASSQRSSNTSSQRPYVSDGTNPVYSQYYGSSYVAVKPLSAPFNKIVEQTDDRFTEEGLDTSQEAKKRKRAESRASSPTVFDPNAPNMPRATTGNYPGLYSVSGFDALSVLARVIFRPSPQIDLGPIDMSTAFCVVDARKSNLPIVYASESFSALTGYPNIEIIGRNCRFLQSPEGKVEQGSQRKYTDGGGVYHLRQHITSARESQVSIVNYKKNKSPFINLISVIPITWDNEQVAYFVGFQLDLAQQPHQLLRRVREGNYTVNLSMLPGPPIPNPASLVMGSADSGHSSGSGSGTPDASSSPSYSAPQAVVEGLPDFVFALSVKGAILYASPAATKALGRSMQEMLSTNISDLCHANDVTHVVRELKEASVKPDSSVNITFRAKHKHGNFFWIDANGKVHVEEGRNRKSIVLVGRHSTVPSLAREVLSSTGGVTTSDFWHRLTPSGLCLYTCPAVERFHGYLPSELVGTSIMPFIRPSEHAAFTGALQSAASKGAASAMRHSFKGKKGNWQEVVTTFFPPTPGQANPTRRQALVVCQTSTFVAKLQKQPSFAQVPLGRTVPFIAPDSANGSHPDNVLAELEPNRNSSWHFELQSLQRSNRSLQAEINRLEQLKASAGARRTASTVAPPQASDSSAPQSTSRHYSAPGRSSCVNCGSSDIRPDQLLLADSALCNTCSMRWQQMPSPGSGQSPQSAAGGYSMDGYDMNGDSLFET